MNQKPSIYGPRFSWIMTKKWYRVDSAICHISKSRLKKLIKPNLYKPNLELHQTIWDDLFTSKKARDECNGYVWVLGGKFFFHTNHWHAFNVTLCTHWLGWIYWFSFLINWKSETPWFERIFGFFGHGLVDLMSVPQINGLSICLSVRSFVRTTELMEISFSDCQSRGKLLQCSSLYAS